MCKFFRNSVFSSSNREYNEYNDSNNYIASHHVVMWRRDYSTVTLNEHYRSVMVDKYGEIARVYIRNKFFAYTIYKTVNNDYSFEVTDNRYNYGLIYRCNELTLHNAVKLLYHAKKRV